MIKFSEFLRSDTQKNNKVSNNHPIRTKHEKGGNEADLFAETVPDRSVLTEGNRNSTSGIVYRKKAKRVTIQRYICSKIAFYPESVTFEDILTVYDNLLWLQDKSVKDEKFHLKFGVPLEVLSKLLKGTRFTDKNLLKTVNRVSQQFKNKLDGFLIPKRNVSTTKIHVSKMYKLKFTKQPGTKNSELPPEQYIGKGYRDKGTARTPHFDGSPTWQEVASSKISECEISRSTDYEII